LTLHPSGRFSVSADGRAHTIGSACAGVYPGACCWPAPPRRLRPTVTPTRALEPPPSARVEPTPRPAAQKLVRCAEAAPVGGCGSLLHLLTPRPLPLTRRSTHRRASAGPRRWLTAGPSAGNLLVTLGGAGATSAFVWRRGRRPPPGLAATRDGLKHGTPRLTCLQGGVLITPR
jgi:hypothetical protein